MGRTGSEGFFLVWVTAAAGIVGSENHRANLLYAGVLLVGIVGALLGRFRARGMFRALVATAIAQAAIAVLVLVAGWGLRSFVLSAFFSGAWLASAALFRIAARRSA